MFANLQPLKLGFHRLSETRRQRYSCLPYLPFKEMVPFSLRKTVKKKKTSKKLEDLHIFHRGKERMYN